MLVPVYDIKLDVTYRNFKIGTVKLSSGVALTSSGKINTKTYNSRLCYES